MRILAIDPGMSGGLCFRAEFNSSVRAALCPMPLVNGRVDVCRMQEWIIEWRPKMAILEIQRNQNGQRGQSAIMINYGRLTAVLDLCGIDTIEVTPQSWQKTLGLTGDKQSHIDYALDAGYDIPTLAPKGKKRHDGIADACCIAEACIIDLRRATC